MRGQSSLEYMLIIGLALIVLASITVARMVNPASESGGDVMLISQARSACDAIADAINDVYGSAEGATRTVWVRLSDTWDLCTTKNPPKLRLSVGTSAGVENLESDLWYGIDNSLLNIPAGSYAVIVDWPAGGEQGVTRVGDKIFIHIDPPTGDEK